MQKVSKPERVVNDLPATEYEHLAALDLGSNSFHLVVTRIVNGSVQIVHRVKQRVALAQGLDEDFQLSPEAIQRGLDALDIMRESLQGFSPEKVRIVATYTLRKARNSYEFIHRARNILPYPVEIISGMEEARLIYSGVSHTSFDEGRRLIVDIGGGSTEIVIGDGFEPLVCRSLEMGCVSFTKRFFTKKTITKKQFKRAITATQQTLSLITNRYTKLGWQTAIGTSGTIKTIIQLIRDKESSDYTPITLSALEALMEDAINVEKIEALPVATIAADRSSVFCAGLAILIGVFKSFNIKQMDFSSSALREGVIFEMQESIGKVDTRERTSQSLAKLYHVDSEQARRVLQTCNDLVAQSPYKWLKKKQLLKNILGWACLLHEVGIHINSRGFQRHSAYIIEHTELAGFNLEEQRLLALLVRFSRKKIRPELINDFEQFSKAQIQAMLVILRLSVLLNIKRQDDIHPQIFFTPNKKQIDVTFGDNWLAGKPIFSADLAAEQKYLKAIGIELTVG